VTATGPRAATFVGSGDTEGDPTAAFRRDLVEWLEAHLTPEVTSAGLGAMDDPEDLARLRQWNQLLYDAGWAAPAWPAAYGGRDASIPEQLAYLEEMSRTEAPGPVNVIGVSNIAPAIMALGTEEQRARFLVPMLRGEEIWSQGMSEPDAGSDLASLRTRAVADGDSFIVNGQKTWNSLGHHADWCQLYVRTDPEVRKHKGISCLLLDMRLPGIEVRPLRTMAGDRTFAEIFLHEVRVPADALLGPLHGGWGVAMTTLSYERAGVARLHLGLGRRLRSLLDDASGRPSLSEAVHRDQVAKLYSMIACMRWSTTRELAALEQGATPSPVSGSLAKLMWARAEKMLGDLAFDLLGPAALSGPWAHNLAQSPQASIAGGTTEVNKSVVAEHGLGLPREP